MANERADDERYGRASASWFTRARSTMLEAIAPTRCAGCERPGALICERCLARMIPVDPAHACTRCGAPFGDMLCTECGAHTSAQEIDDASAHVGRCLAATVFEDPVPRIIRAYKDAGERRLAPLIAELMLDAAEHAETTAPQRYGGLLSQADFIVFVPATAAAFARRGFDHMEAIAREFSQLSGVPVLDALCKYGRSDQRVLGRAARAEHARGAYEVVEPVRGMRLLLLDDVITTGATIRAASGALEAAGAAHVDALACTRVW